MCNMLDCLIHVNSLSVVGDILPFKPCNSIVSGYWMVFKPFWSEIQNRVISTRHCRMGMDFKDATFYCLEK